MSDPTLSNSVLSDSGAAIVPRLIEYIQRQPQQQVTFAEYMDWVLYQPGGYYSDRPGIGPNQTPQGPAAGDFVTSPHLCADFGELLAVQLIDMWKQLGQPQPFQIVEMGAGHGLLAVDILRYLAREAVEMRVDYRIIERSPSLRCSQQQQLQASGLASSLLDNIHWQTWEDLADQSITGCFLSNELVDAFPVHWVEVTDTNGLKDGSGGQQLREVYVRWDGHAFVSGLGELSLPELSDYFETFALALDQYPVGYRTEINLAARDWVQTLGRKLARGYCLTIDYGYSAKRYYQSSRRGGTLQCYYRHSFHDDPLINVGQQDITAHVNFTALEQWGEAAGLESLGFTQQGLFLMALGVGDRLQALATDATDMSAVQQMIQRREQLHQLMNPMGLGNFGVLIQGKGLSSHEREQGLQGLMVPPLSY